VHLLDGDRPAGRGDVERGGLTLRDFGVASPDRVQSRAFGEQAGGGPSPQLVLDSLHLWGHVAGHQGVPVGSRGSQIGCRPALPQRPGQPIRGLEGDFSVGFGGAGRLVAQHCGGHLRASKGRNPIGHDSGVAASSSSTRRGNPATGTAATPAACCEQGQSQGEDKPSAVAQRDPPCLPSRRCKPRRGPGQRPPAERRGGGEPERVCKPGSVPRTSRPSGVTISLGDVSPRPSCDLSRRGSGGPPAGSPARGRTNPTPRGSCSRRGLPSQRVTALLVGSYPTVAPLPASRRRPAVFISVALS